MVGVVVEELARQAACEAIFQARFSMNLLGFVWRSNKNLHSPGATDKKPTPRTELDMSTVAN
jgi:hypothetical protein